MKLEELKQRSVDRVSEEDLQQLDNESLVKYALYLKDMYKSTQMVSTYYFEQLKEIKDILTFIESALKLYHKLHNNESIQR